MTDQDDLAEASTLARDLALACAAACLACDHAGLSVNCRACQPSCVLVELIYNGGVARACVDVAAINGFANRRCAVHECARDLLMEVCPEGKFQRLN